MSRTPAEIFPTRILLVDDHPITRDVVRAILKNEGFTTILVAENGSAALEVMKIEQVELVICDWNMPTMTGVELLKKVRAIPEYEKLPFLMLTAEAYRENVNEALQAGVSDYISKPFTAEVLSVKVYKALGCDQPPRSRPQRSQL